MNDSNHKSIFWRWVDRFLLPERSMRPTLRQLVLTLAILAVFTGIGALFHELHFTEANIITVYILSVLLTALFTGNYVCSGLSSLVGVLLFNFFFTEPRLSFRAYESGYPVTFAIMLVASLITGTLVNRVTAYAKERAEAEYRVKNEQLRADLLRSISHDLRTPLTSISGNAENLLANDATLDGAERKAVLTDIYADSIWLIRLVENLLALTKIGEGRICLNLTAELVDEVIAGALEHIDRRNHDHIIETALDDELLLARMDAGLISQVIVNLVDNAIKYTPPGSRIRLSARAVGNQIEISVADNGAGLTDAQKKKVFTLFYTGDAKPAGQRGGIGLGLALCRSIVTAHGGAIRLTDNQPSGCVFTFTLPASEVTINA